MEIQQALIREHYMDGEATGEWDQATRDATIGRLRFFPIRVRLSSWVSDPVIRIC
jgi:hypothetical protein